LKKAWIIAILAILLLAVAGGYMMLDGLFPKAAPIVLPPKDAVSTVLVSSGDTGLTLTKKEFEPILKAIENARPTRKMSVNDTPSAREYYAVKASAEREYTYFVYLDGGAVYVEMPYSGVYRSEKGLIGMLQSLFEK